MNINYIHDVYDTNEQQIIANQIIARPSHIKRPTLSVRHAPSIYSKSESRRNFKLWRRYDLGAKDHILPSYSCS